MMQTFQFPRSSFHTLSLFLYLSVVAFVLRTFYSFWHFSFPTKIVTPSPTPIYRALYRGAGRFLHRHSHILCCRDRDRDGEWKVSKAITMNTNAKRKTGQDRTGKRERKRKAKEKREEAHDAATSAQRKYFYEKPAIFMLLFMPLASADFSPYSMRIE